ncbi:C-type mannose receptor 2, partial [Biomphalaria glabrata]
RHGCVALTSFVWETQDCNTSLPFMCEDRQDTSSDTSTSRRSSGSIIRSELSTQWMPGLYPLLTNTSNEILIDTEESDGSAPGYDRLRSLVIRQARVRPSCPSGWIQSLGICFK